MCYRCGFCQKVTKPGQPRLLVIEYREKSIPNVVDKVVPHNAFGATVRRVQDGTRTIKEISKETPACPLCFEGWKSGTIPTFVELYGVSGTITIDHRTPEERAKILKALRSMYDGKARTSYRSSSDLIPVPEIRIQVNGEIYSPKQLLEKLNGQVRELEGSRATNSGDVRDQTEGQERGQPLRAGGRRDARLPVSGEQVRGTDSQLRGKRGDGNNGQGQGRGKGEGASRKPPP